MTDPLISELVGTEEGETGPSLIIKHQAEAWCRVATECVMLGAHGGMEGRNACEQVINFIRGLHQRLEDLEGQ